MPGTTWALVGAGALVVVVTGAVAARQWRRRRSAPWSLRALLDVVSDALVVVGLDGTVIDVNRAGARLMSEPPAPDAPHAWGRPRTLDPALAPVLAGDGERTLTLGCGVLRVRTTTVYENGVAIARILSARDITELDRLRSELVDQAARDTLTGLLNRRDLAHHLGAMVDEARRTGRPLSIAMVDMDHLKELNDRFGHRAGDAGIVGVAQVLSSPGGMCPSSGLSPSADDLVVRVGGDEFLVAMAGTDLDAAELRGQLWRVGAGRLSLGAGVPRVTLSIGVAQLEPQMDVDAFVTAADGALYAAKAAGRNRVHVRPVRPVRPVRAGPQAGPAGAPPGTVPRPARPGDARTEAAR